MTIPSFVMEHLLRDVKLNGSEISELLQRCEVREIEYQGAVSCALFISGNEVHLVGNPEYRGRTGSRRLVRDTFASLLEEKDFVTTRIPIDTPPRDRTGERMGFTHTWSDQRFDYYILTEVPYARHSV